MGPVLIILGRFRKSLGSVLNFHDRYKIEITTTPDDPTSWKTVLDYGALNRMEIRNLVCGQEIHIRVSGGNTHGWGIPSEVVTFLPR